MVTLFKAKESSLISISWSDEIFFITCPPAYVTCVWEYIFFVSKKKPDKLKNFHWQIYSYKFTFFFLSKNKYIKINIWPKYSKMRVDIYHHCFFGAHFNCFSHGERDQIFQCKLLMVSTRFSLIFPKMLYSFW